MRNLNFEKRQKYIYSTNIPIGYILEFMVIRTSAHARMCAYTKTNLQELYYKSYGEYY